jgi:hypothetical protein
MAFSARGLVRGALQGLTAYRGGQLQGQLLREQREREQAEREQQARYRLLQERALMQQLNRPAPIDPLSEEGAQRLVERERLSSEARRADQEAAERPVAEAFARADPSLAGLPISEQVRRGRQKFESGLIAGRQRDTVIEKQPQVTEREKATYGALSLQANEIIGRLEARDPGIGARVASKAANYKAVIGGLAGRLLGASEEQTAAAAEAQIERSMSPDELAYYKASKQFLANVLPALSGKAVTAREWLMQAPSFFSLGAGTPETIVNQRNARVGRVRGFFREAGSAAANPVLEELRAAGYDLTPYGFGASSPTVRTPETPRAPRYNPKFWQPEAP